MYVKEITVYSTCTVLALFPGILGTPGNEVVLDVHVGGQVAMVI